MTPSRVTENAAGVRDSARMDGISSATHTRGVDGMKPILVIPSAFALLCFAHAQQRLIPDDPEIRVPFTLTAAYDAEAGHNAFFFASRAVPPVIRALPGTAIKIRYVNNLPTKSSEEC